MPQIFGRASADPDTVRLQQILERWRRHPGSAPEGTGTTGLQPNDARGWSQLLNDQTFALEQLSGRPVHVRQAPLQEVHLGSLGQNYYGATPTSPEQQQALAEALQGQQTIGETVGPETRGIDWGERAIDWRQHGVDYGPGQTETDWDQRAIDWRQRGVDFGTGRTGRIRAPRRA